MGLSGFGYRVAGIGFALQFRVYIRFEKDVLKIVVSVMTVLWVSWPLERKYIL